MDDDVEEEVHKHRLAVGWSFAPIYAGPRDGAKVYFRGCPAFRIHYEIDGEDYEYELAEGDDNVAEYRYVGVRVRG